MVVVWQAAHTTCSLGVALLPDLHPFKETINQFGGQKKRWWWHTMLWKTAHWGYLVSGCLAQDAGMSIGSRKAAPLWSSAPAPVLTPLHSLVVWHVLMWCVVCCVVCVVLCCVVCGGVWCAMCYVWWCSVAWCGVCITCPTSEPMNTTFSGSPIKCNAGFTSLNTLSSPANMIVNVPSTLTVTHKKTLLVLHHEYLVLWLPCQISCQC